MWENGGANGTGTNTAHFLQGMARAMPPMMQILKDIGGVEIPDYIAKLSPEGGGASAPAREKPASPKEEAPLPKKG